MSDRKTALSGRSAIVPGVVGVLLLAPIVFPFALMGCEAFRALRDAVHGEVARGLPGALIGLWMTVQFAAGIWFLLRAYRALRRAAR